MKHLIRIGPAAKLDTRGRFYEAICTCGNYRSGPVPSEGKAKSRGAAHQRDAEANDTNRQG